MKICLPLAWKLELLAGILALLGSGPRDAVVAEARDVLEPPVSLRPPVSGPPASWIRDHGSTPKCKACEHVVAG